MVICRLQQVSCSFRFQFELKEKESGMKIKRLDLFETGQAKFRAAN
jgi:hypothetical protein